MFFQFLSCFVFGFCLGAKDYVTVSYDSQLPEVSVEKLHKIVLHSPYTIALIQNDTEITNAEETLIRLKNDLASKLHLSVIKINDSNSIVKQQYGHSDANILFFRHTKPIAFDGSIELDNMKQWLLQNINSFVQHLDNDSIDALLQSISNKTPEDWLVLFCNGSDISCQTLQPVWDTVSSRLKSEKTLAFVDTDKYREISTHFQIENSPELILFRSGKMYRYAYPSYEVPSIISFASESYEQEEAESIPKVPEISTSSNNIISSIVQKIKTELEDPYAVPALVMLTLPFSIVLAAVIAKGRDYKAKDD